jgi:hypothetical protein
MKSGKPDPVVGQIANQIANLLRIVNPVFAERNNRYNLCYLNPWRLGFLFRADRAATWLLS